MTRRFKHPLALAATLSLTLLASGCVIQGPPALVTPTNGKPRPSGGGGANAKDLTDRLDAGVRNAITYKSREDKVAVMTEAFSLSRNQGMARATASFKAMGSSLAGLQNLVSGQVRQDNGMMRYDVEGGPSLRVIGTRSRYALAGLKSMRQGDAVLQYDDKSRELTSIQGKDTELRFKFDDRGNTRAWSSEIVKSPDGTTGLLSVEATSVVWKAYEVPQPSPPVICPPPRPVATRRPTPWPSMAPSAWPSTAPSAWPSTAPSAWPSMAPSAWPSMAPTPGPSMAPSAIPSASVSARPSPTPLALQQFNDGMVEGPDTSWPPEPNDPTTPPGYGYDNGYDQDYGYQPCRPDPNWVAPEPIPFVVAGGEYPEFVEALKLGLQITPKGDESLAIGLQASLDEPANVPGTNMRLPTHWKFVARVPGLTFDWDSRLNLIPNNMTFEASGKMVVEVEQGEELFNYGLTLRQAGQAGTFSMTNVGAKMKLLITSDNGMPPQTRLLSTEQGKETELGTVVMKPGTANVALVRFNDGKRMEWELFPTDLFGTFYGVPGGFLPSPEPMAPARPVMRKRDAIDGPEVGDDTGYDPEV